MTHLFGPDRLGHQIDSAYRTDNGQSEEKAEDDVCSRRGTKTDRWKCGQCGHGFITAKGASRRCPVCDFDNDGTYCGYRTMKFGGAPRVSCSGGPPGYPCVGATCGFEKQDQVKKVGPRGVGSAD